MTIIITDDDYVDANHQNDSCLNSNDDTSVNRIQSIVFVTRTK